MRRPFSLLRRFTAAFSFLAREFGRGMLGTRVNRLAGFFAVVSAMVLLPAAAQAVTPSIDIHSAGPLTDIYIGNDLSCQVRSGGFSSTEYFPNASGPGDCGTFLFLNSDNVTGGLFGPDFTNHPGGTNTSFPNGEVPFTTSPGNQSITGSGSVASPYKVTTTVTVTSHAENVPVVLQITQVDSYIVGANSYRTDVTVTNTGRVTPDNGAELYHAADCMLRGANTGFGAYEPSSSSANTAACTPNMLGNPPSALEEFEPITSGNHWEQKIVPKLWSDLNGMNLADSCLSCRGTAQNTGEAIEYAVPALAPGQSQTFSFDTKIVDTTLAGGFSFSGSQGTAVGGTVATITDPDASATPSAYSATINWGDGNSSVGAIGGGNGSLSVTGNHSYAAGGTYPIAVTVTAVGTNQGSSTVTDSAIITAQQVLVITGSPNPVITGVPAVGSSTRASFTGFVNPNGLATTARFEYGLDSRYSKPGTSGPEYVHSTLPQSVGSDFASHTVSASVTGLVPNAIYHVRLVATNSAGTTNGLDVVFKTRADPAPSAPTLGKTFNVSATGLVLIKLHGVFVPLTELRQIPNGTIINALHGTLTVTTAAAPGGTQHATLSKASKNKKKPKTQSGRFGGAVFKLTQSHSGLATLSLVEGAKFKGAPTYASCKTKKRRAVAAALSKKTLQLLHGRAHGKFRSKGRYAAATVRGTIWTIADRCDGTLTHAIKDTVTVSDFVRHKTIILRPGHSYLALANPPHKRK